MFECTKCHQSLNPDQFYKDSSKKRGHASWCKSCSNNRESKRIPSPVRIKPINLDNATKQCSRCKLWKYKDYFNKAGKNRDGLNYSCKSCISKITEKYRDRKDTQRKSWIRNTVRGWAYTSLKHMKERIEYDCSLTIDDIEKLYHFQNGKCALTGVEFVFGDVSDHRPSVDRIDPTRGYHIDNVRITTWRVNRTKSNLNDTEYIDMCRAVCGHIIDSRGTQPLLRILNPFPCNELSRYV